MASPAERSVYIAAIHFQVQALNGRTQQNRRVVTGTFSFFVHSAGTGLESERLKLSRQICVVAIVQPPISCLIPALFIPEFEAIALPEQHCLPIEPGELAQLARQENASVTVDIHFSGMSDHQPLQAASSTVETRQAHQLAFDFFPVREWIEEEAVVPVDRRYQVAIATGLDPFPVTGRNCQTPFRVQCDFGGPTQHGIDSGSGNGYRSSKTAFTPSSHFSPLFAILFGRFGTVNQ